MDFADRSDMLPTHRVCRQGRRSNRLTPDPPRSASKDPDRARGAPVSATLRDVEHAARFVIEFGAEPLTEGWAAGAQGDGCIEHGAAGTARELDLGIRHPLIVRAAKCARR